MCTHVGGVDLCNLYVQNETMLPDMFHEQLLYLTQKPILPSVSGLPLC